MLVSLMLVVSLGMYLYAHIIMHVIYTYNNK